MKADRIRMKQIILSYFIPKEISIIVDMLMFLLLLKTNRSNCSCTVQKVFTWDVLWEERTLFEEYAVAYLSSVLVRGWDQHPLRPPRFLQLQGKVASLGLQVGSWGWAACPVQAGEEYQGQLLTLAMVFCSGFEPALVGPGGWLIEYMHHISFSIK